MVDTSEKDRIRKTHNTPNIRKKNHGQGHLEMNKQAVINLFNPVTSKPHSTHSHYT